ncbi:glycosyltransferase family 4 protein [Paenibacillus sp. GCM10023252]|uniref:glycosyltransferase family 4 protein n=1 Tax=Paenibacillus sp. GCM10023252 TaxID=3252649 RepID=UPI0036119B72
MLTIDLRMLNHSGIGTYLQNLVPVVINNLRDIEICMLGNKEQLEKLAIDNLTTIDNIKIVAMDSPIYSIKEQKELLEKIPKQTKLFWSPHFNIPIFYRGKLLVTIHDVFHLVMKEHIGGIHKQLYAKLMFKAIKNRASSIICVSEFTKQELINHNGSGKQKIVAIHNGINKNWLEVIKSDSLKEEDPFLLYVGNVKPHKNLSTLINAFNLIKDEIPHNLIIIGKKEGFLTGDSKIFDEVQKTNGRVKFTGFIEQDTLEQYYANADCLVFPSLYEGFGFPPLEAMATGCPVISSNAASLPEVCEDAVVYINPLDSDDIASKIVKTLGDNKLREEIVIKGKKQAKKFTWDNCAKETINVIKEVVNQ